MKLHGLFGRRPHAEITVTPATPDLFLLRTGRDTWLTLEPDSTDIGMSAAATPQTAILAAIPRGVPQAGMLIAPDGRPISVEGDGMTAPAISFRLRRVPGGRVELRHPVAPVRHLGVLTGIPFGRANRVLFDRVGDKVLDWFELHPGPADMAAEPARALLREIAVAVTPKLGADRLMALLHAGTVREALAETLIRALPADELAILARRLLTQPADLALVRRAMKKDPWIDAALPGLVAWCETDRPVTSRTVSPATEAHVSVLQSGDLRPQAGIALHALARRAIAPRRTCAVLATARNEGPYILDWLAHHRAIGFEHAVIYSNDNDDGSDDLLDLLARHGEITWVRNELSPAARAQWKAYGHAFKALPDLLDFRWTMVLDLDEYVGFRPDMFASVQELIGWHEYQPIDALALRWLTFASGRMESFHDAPSTRRFRRREPDVSPLFKSLVRANMFWDSHCHFPFPTMDAPFAFKLEDGAACHHMGKLKGLKVPEDPVTADTAWVAHHVFRSAGEALMKASRGDATWSAATRADSERLDSIIKRFVALADHPGLVSDDRTLNCAPGLDAQLTRLRGLPGLRACDEAIKHRYAAQVAAMSEAFISAQMAEDRPKEFRMFQNILRNQAARRREEAA